MTTASIPVVHATAPGAPEGAPLRGTPLEAHPPLSADTATPRQRATGFALMLTSSMLMPVGASVGAKAFPTIGPVGVVAVRQILTALVLVPLVRPRLRGLRRDQWLPILGLVLVMNLMNLPLYFAIERIGVGLAITLEFLGPLSIAIASSRRLIDIICAVLAGVGVVTLTNPGPSTDVLGISLALVAAGGWAAYILITRSVGQRLPGLEGTAAASLITGALWVPVGITWFILHPPTLGAILAALACGVLASIVPFVADMLALRRVPAGVFGIFTSLNPVWAALAGLVVLGQVLLLNEWIGIALIITASLIVSLRALLRS
ncbi:EamA family transporter [Leucobacter sp. GX24907]